MWGMGEMFAVYGGDNFVGPIPVAQPATVQALLNMLPLEPGQSAAQRLAAATAAALDYAQTMMQRGQAPALVDPGVYYRPQFVPAPTPQGFHDVDFIAYFDAISTPVLGITLQAGAEQLDVPLQLENDADFIFRGIRILATLASERGGGLPPRFQFKTPDGTPLSSKFPALPPRLDQSYRAGGLNLGPTGTYELPTVPTDAEVLCPASSAFLMNVYNPNAVPATLSGFIAFFGVKRYANG
jgi:hypothetical protein